MYGNGKTDREGRVCVDQVECNTGQLYVLRYYLSQ